MGCSVGGRRCRRASENGGKEPSTQKDLKEIFRDKVEEK